MGNLDYTGGVGGQASSGMGDIKYSDGNGGNNRTTVLGTLGSGAGGGGGAGSLGNGGNGADGVVVANAGGRGRRRSVTEFWYGRRGRSTRSGVAGSASLNYGAGAGGQCGLYGTAGGAARGGRTLCVCVLE